MFYKWWIFNCLRKRFYKRLAVMFPGALVHAINDTGSNYKITSHSWKQKAIVHFHCFRNLKLNFFFFCLKCQFISEIIQTKWVQFQYPFRWSPSNYISRSLIDAMLFLKGYIGKAWKKEDTASTVVLQLGMQELFQKFTKQKKSSY